MSRTTGPLRTIALGFAAVIAGIQFSNAQGDSSSSPAAYTNSMSALDNSHELSIGDLLSFRIVEDRRRSPIKMPVLETGEVDVPYVGRVAAKGRTCRQLAQDIKSRLDRDYYYDSTVILALDGFSERSRGVVYMRGAIAQSTALPIPPDEELTLSKAILRAGGFTTYSNKRKVTVLRKNGDGQTSETIVVDMKEVLENGKFDQDIVLQPDDIVTIPERGIVF